MRDIVPATSFEVAGRKIEREAGLITTGNVCGRPKAVALRSGPTL